MFFFFQMPLSRDQGFVLYIVILNHTPFHKSYEWLMSIYESEAKLR